MKKSKFRIRRGDIVQVISGNHKKREGKVTQVNLNKCWVTIEGIRMMKKHVRRSRQFPEGGIVEYEGPIHLSNVKLIHRDNTDQPKWAH